MEAARVPWRLLGELFVEKGLVTPDQLEAALAEQKTSGKHLGEILVSHRLVSPFELTIVVAEQMGVEVELQKGFGSGLWNELKRRHARTEPVQSRNGENGAETRPGPSATSSIEDWLDSIASESESSDEEPEPRDQRATAPEPSSDSGREVAVPSLPRQVTGIEQRPSEERAKHQARRELLEEGKAETAKLADELAGFREQLVRIEEGKQAELARHDAPTEVASEGERAAALERELTAAPSTVAKLEQRRYVLEQERHELRRSLEAGENELAVKAETGAAFEQELVEVTRYEELVEELREILAAKDAALSERESALAGEMEARRTLEEELSAAREAADELSELVSARGSELEHAKAALHELRDGLAMRGGAEAHEQGARISPQRELRLARGTAATLDGKLDETVTQKAALEQRLGSLREQPERRHEEMDALRGRAAQAERAAMNTAVAGEEVAPLERTVGELHEALAWTRGAEARAAQLRAEAEQDLARARAEAAAVEERLAEALAVADGAADATEAEQQRLDERLRQERVAHVAARRQVGEVESRLASLEPVAMRLHEAEAELAAQMTRLQEMGDELVDARRAVAARERGIAADVVSAHVLFAPAEHAYRLLVVEGPPPDEGVEIELDGRPHRVLRVGRSPLPGDPRPCALLAWE